jgi:hypothetical protein
LQDLEGTIWRGGLSLAVEEYLLACEAPGAALRTQSEPPPLEEELHARLAQARLAQRPLLLGDAARLQEARERARAAAPALSVQAEAAGLFWVDGGLLQGLAPGCRLHTLDAEGEPTAALEVVEVGVDRCGCAPVAGDPPMELPARVCLAAPGQPPPSAPALVAPHVGVRLLSAVLDGGGSHAIPLAFAPSPPAHETTRATRTLLDLLMPDPAPGGLEVWPDAFTPVLPPPETGADDTGPVRLVIAQPALQRAASLPTEPIRLTCRMSLPAGERQPAALVALAFDGHDFYPVSQARLSPPPPLPAPVEAESARLRRGRASLAAPAPVAEHLVTLEIPWLPGGQNGERAALGVTRTVQLYLYAVAGLHEPTQGLFQVRYVPQAWAAAASPAAIVRPVAGGSLRYTPALPARPGERIALLLHGFADDSAEEALWLLRDLHAAGIRYDRVLTFEYESLHTSIEENALRLATALHELGFAPPESERTDRVNLAGDAPTIDLFGHSMGALIGRWLIEKLGGDRVIQRSVFFGSPNAGTPLASASLLAPWLLAAAINVARPALPSIVLAWALGLLALDAQGPADLRPGAPALAHLQQRARPVRTRYHLIAGDISGLGASEEEADLAASATNCANSVDAGADETARLARLLDTLKDSAHAAGSLFYGGAHDWAVSVQSALALHAGRTPGSSLLARVVTTHHLGYFTTPEVTEQVARWLAQPEDALG